MEKTIRLGTSVLTAARHRWPQTSRDVICGCGRYLDSTPRRLQAMGLCSRLYGGTARTCRQLSTKAKEAVEDGDNGLSNGEAVSSDTYSEAEVPHQTTIDANTQHQQQTQTPVDSCPTPKNDKVTIFYRPSKRIFNIPLDPNSTNVSFYVKKTNRVVNLTFRKEFSQEQLKELLVNDPEDTVPAITKTDQVRWKEIQSIDPRQLHNIYMQLAKIRLTGLVVVTTMAGYAMGPGVFDLSTFLMCSVGTALTSASANTINQYFEVPFDSQMNRTKNRPLVRGVVSPLHAMAFAATAATTGTAILYLGVNPLTAGLGLFNIGLYTLAYTPLKRLSVYNTWVGSVVGAIPPVMGWTACMGTLDPGALLLAAYLFAWQFPHFNALSWNLRQDYSRAGYRMLSVVNPAQCKRVALRYSLAMIPICTLAPVLDVTTWYFAVDSLPFNLYQIYLAWNFYRQGDSNSSRKLFRFTLLHIPAIMMLMLVSKKHFGMGEKAKAVTGVEEGGVTAGTLAITGTEQGGVKAEKLPSPAAEQGGVIKK